MTASRLESLSHRQIVLPFAVLISVGISPTACNEATAPSGIAPETVFVSQWGTALGNSEEALTDGGSWDRLVTCGGSFFNVAEVISGASVGWTRTANVLRVQQRGATECGNVERIHAVPASTTHWGRFYFRNDERQTSHGHPVTYNCCGDIQIVPWARIGQPDGVVVGTGAENQPYPLNVFYAGAEGESRHHLPHRTWFRYEWMIEYLTENTFRIYPRIYNMEDELLYDVESFFQNDYPQSGFQTLKSMYDGGSVGVVRNLDLARNFGLGNEGPGGSVNNGQNWYIADVALSTAGWIGP